MVNVFVWRTQKDDDIVYIDKGKFPLEFRHYDVLGLLKHPLQILQSEGLADEAKKALIRRESGFISIFLGHLYLPISTVRLPCRKYRCIANSVDAFVHAWYLVRIPNLHWVERALIDAKAKSSILLKD